MQIRPEKHHGAIKSLALGMQGRPPDGLWAIMRGRLDTQENRPNLQGIRASRADSAPKGRLESLHGNITCVDTAVRVV